MTNLLFALRRSALVTLAASLALALAACAPADDAANGPNATATVTGGAVEITADNLEFDVDTIEAPAGEPFTITLVNDDTAPHNISIYTEEGGERIVQGETIQGGETVDVDVPALDAGEYFFVCDIHPQDMTGTVVIEG